MRIGVNWTSIHSLSVIQKLISNKMIDFCEILFDNFLHLSPTEIGDVLQDVPISFHIMNSKFLERDLNELSRLGKKIQIWARMLKPIYISDHVAHFTVSGRRLPLLAEIDYDSEYAKVKQRVLTWQEMLNEKIYLENFPSGLDTNGAQIQFYDRLLRETDAGLLFDFSNAVIAEKNESARIKNWLPLISRVRHFHVGGFRYSDTVPVMAIDTHDVALSDETIAFMQDARKLLSPTIDSTLVVERDANIELRAWANDILRAKQIYD